MRIIISGGGTGGHVFPAIAIADAIKEKDPKAEILFVGANGKMEMEKVPAAGYEIRGLNIAGFHRKQMTRNFGFPFKLLGSMISAVSIIRKFKPEIVIGVGGYASGPMLKAASWLNIPTVIQEQNSYAGVTNKLLAKKAKRIYVAYEGMERFFEEEKIRFVGNPVRKEVYDNKLSMPESRELMGCPREDLVVLISGGSLGARSINEAIAASYEDIKSRPDVFFVWQVGKLYYDEFKNDRVAKLPNVRVVTFIDNMAAAYIVAEIIVCRAGALTISELCLTCNPPILIPSPNVAEDHQTHNAMSLVDNGAAIMIKDDEAKEKLGKAIFDLLDDEDKKTKLIKGLDRLGRENAAEVIARDVLTMLNK